MCYFGLAFTDTCCFAFLAVLLLPSHRAVSGIRCCTAWCTHLA